MIAVRTEYVRHWLITEILAKLLFRRDYLYSRFAANLIIILSGEMNVSSQTALSKTVRDLTRRIREFNKVRDWEKFHSPKNLAMALCAESAELLEHFLWLSEKQSRMPDRTKLNQIEEEVGDVMIHLLNLADKLGIDPIKAANDKIRKNEIKYPADRVRGKALKYSEY